METTIQKLKVRHLFCEATKERKSILNYCYNIVQKTAFLKRIFAKYSIGKKKFYILDMKILYFLDYADWFFRILSLKY